MWGGEANCMGIVLYERLKSTCCAIYKSLSRIYIHPGTAPEVGDRGRYKMQSASWPECDYCTVQNEEWLIVDKKRGPHLIGFFTYRFGFLQGDVTSYTCILYSQ